MSGFITIHRKMLEWEWYQDTNVKVVFLHCLLKANWKDGRFQGHAIPRGSFVTSYENLANDVLLSVQQVRTALNKLKSTNEITSHSSNHFTVITITNYALYQNEQQAIQQTDNKRITNKQQTDNKRITTIEQRNKETKKQYGEHKNVLLTPNEYYKLVERFSLLKANAYIDRLDMYVGSKGAKYKSHYMTILNWAQKDNPKTKDATEMTPAERALASMPRN